MAESVEPVTLVTLYTSKALDEILRLLREKPPTGTVFLGTQGVSRPEANKIKQHGAGALYAPVYLLDPNDQIHKNRPVKIDPKLDKNPDFVGPPPPATPQDFPTPPARKRLPARDQRAWGLEIGRRFRDQVERERAILLKNHR